MRDTALVLRGGAGRGAVGIDYGRFDALECSDAPGSSSAEDGSGGDEGFRARVEAIRGRPDEQEGGGQRDAQRGRKGEPLIRKEQPKDIADSGQDPGPMKNDPGGGGRNEEQGGGGGEREGYGRAREASANKRGAGETPGVAEDLDAARVAKKVDDVSGEVVCEWDQSYEDVNVWVTLPASAKASDVALECDGIGREAVEEDGREAVEEDGRNETVLEGERSEPVRIPPESFWLRVECGRKATVVEQSS
ncbi:hypothetical protein T484DRAFT_1855396 [Baffinella frigidus]|nr:hypothetical protein T484DRAFT_1855396 [Cryptophyta sp. CCMP2293]